MIISEEDAKILEKELSKDEYKKMTAQDIQTKLQEESIKHKLFGDKSWRYDWKDPLDDEERYSIINFVPVSDIETIMGKL